MNSPRFSRIVRRTHMYLALFLIPWMLVYALSSLVFNHFGTVRNWYGGNLNRFELLEEREYHPDLSESTTPAEAARAILTDLNMEGSHFVQGGLNQDRLTINRQFGFTARRIIYFPNEQRIRIEQLAANTPNFLTRLHTRHGYEQEDSASQAWGLTVELTVIAMVFWVLSGLWLWWEIKPARLWGGIFALLGLGLFVVLLVSI